MTAERATPRVGAPEAHGPLLLPPAKAPSTVPVPSTGTPIPTATHCVACVAEKAIEKLAGVVAASSNETGSGTVT